MPDGSCLTWTDRRDGWQIRRCDPLTLKNKHTNVKALVRALTDMVA